MPYGIRSPQLMKMNPMDILRDLTAIKANQQQMQMQEEKFKDWQETKSSPEEVRTGRKLELAEKELTNEEKLLDIGSTKLKMLSGPGDYPAYRDNMIKMGFNPDLLPDTFESPEKFEDWRMKALMTAGEYGKMLKGEPFTLSRANPDGTISEVPITSKDQMQQFIDNGLLDPNAGWQLGAMKGTPSAGPESPFKLFYKAKKQQGLEDAEIDTLWEARELKEKEAGATRVSQNVTTRQETEEAKVVGKGFGETYMKIQDAGIAADKTINQYGRVKELLTSARTGKIRPTTITIAAYAKDLGFNIDPGLPAAQALQALTNQIALELRNPSGGAGMPGALSDKDVQFLKESIPGLAQTPEGNELMIDYAMKLAQRNKEVAKLARDYRKKHGAINEGFYDELDKFSAANPLFGGKKRVGRFTVEEE